MWAQIGHTRKGTMATIRKKRKKWQVLVRRKGCPNISKTLPTYLDAIKFAQESEDKINKGLFQDLSEAQSTTLADALKRYRDEVCPTRKWGHYEALRINKLMRNKICDYSLARITSNKIAKFRNELSLTLKPSTVNKYLTMISVIYNTAKSEWDINCINPVSKIKRMVEPEPLDERLSKEDEVKILKYASSSNVYWLRAITVVALESGMRLGELLKLQRKDVDLTKCIATLRETKNGSTRKIGFSPAAVEELKLLAPSIDGRFFPLNHDQFKNVWRRMLSRLKIHVRFHLLRHEWASRMFENGWDISAVATQGGWKDWKVLRRYTSLTPEYLASKFKQIQ